MKLDSWKLKRMATLLATFPSLTTAAPEALASGLLAGSVLAVSTMDSLARLLQPSTVLPSVR